MLITSVKKLAPRTKMLDADLQLAGSKSIANRLLPLAAVSYGDSILYNVPDNADDVCLMINALWQLGIKITALTTPHSYLINGCAGRWPNNKQHLFCGNSGTVMRFLTAMLAITTGSYQLTGIMRMQARPIADLVLSLMQLGARIEYLKQNGYPPLAIKNFHDTKQELITCNGNKSSQYLTGLLMALSYQQREINTIIEVATPLVSKTYVDMTLAILAQFGCHVEVDYPRYIVPASTKLQAVNYTIEPDASLASYFLACGAVNGRVTIKALGNNSLQADAQFARILEKMGARVAYTATTITVNAVAALTAITIDMNDMPDSAMTLAVLSLFAKGTSHISGISTWQIKECDRLRAMQTELQKLGAMVTITASTITIIPPATVTSNVTIDTYDDHRMAMAFSIVAAYGIAININNYQCVNKTCANYFSVFADLCYV